MTKQTPEGKLKKECRAWLRAQGAYVFSPVQVGMGAATVDDLVCFRGRFIAVEYKRPDTRPEPTKRQLQALAEVAAAGGSTALVYSLEDLQSVL